MANNSWGAIIKKVMPAVVTIVISKNLEEIEKEVPPELWSFLPHDENNKLKIPDEAVDSRGMVKIGSGSGFIVDQSGIVITNKHVVADPKAEYVCLGNDGKKHKIEILARDPVDDVAIFRINPPPAKLVTIKLGDSNKLELGEPVLTIGNALGLFKNTVSSGIVSGLSRSIAAAPDPKSPVQEMRGLIQTDAAVNPGNSGGPLLNLRGEVVGINTAIVFGAQNLSFAIPINAAKRDLADLKNEGRITRPLLGLRYINIDSDMKEKMKLPVDYGALVMGHPPLSPGVIPNSPAERAGLQTKDIILECDGAKLTTEKTLQDILEEKDVGDILALKVLRGRKEIVAKVMLVERK